MRKWIILIIVCLSALVPIHAEAGTGAIEIQLPNTSTTKVEYVKVATMVNGRWELDEAYKESGVDLNALENAAHVENAIKVLMKYRNAIESVLVEKESSILLQDLEEGLYLISFSGNAEIDISSVLVGVPSWTGDDMVHNVRVIPKYRERISAPRTGETFRGEIYRRMILISLIIIAGLSCHNCLKCGKITFKHSDIGGYTNGNDNDAKNPRCSRGVRQRSSRSVN